MGWLFEVQIERDHNGEITQEHHFVEAENIADVMADYEIDALDETAEIVMIKRHVPIVRHVLSREKTNA